MLLTAEQAFAERMAGGHDYSLGDIHVRATRSNPLSGAGAATTARNGPTFKPDVPASLPSGVGGYLLDSVEGYDTIGGPWLIFEPVDMGSLGWRPGHITRYQAGHLAGTRPGHLSGGPPGHIED